MQFSIDCRAVSKQKTFLDRAAKSKASIDGGIKALAKSGQQADADTLEASVAGAQQHAGLLQKELKASHEALAKFELLRASPSEAGQSYEGGK